jgi:hypothetical protein
VMSRLDGGSLPDTLPRLRSFHLLPRRRQDNSTEKCYPGITKSGLIEINAWSITLAYPQSCDRAVPWVPLGRKLLAVSNERALRALYQNGIDCPLCLVRMSCAS